MDNFHTDLSSLVSATDDVDGDARVEVISDDALEVSAGTVACGCTWLPSRLSTTFSFLREDTRINLDIG